MLYFNIIMILLMLITIISLLSVERIIKKSYTYLKTDHRKYDDLTEYSESILKFTENIINKISMFKFKSYIDGHDLDKVTKINIQKLVEDVAKSVNESIDYDKIDFNKTIFTKEFYESFIIERSFATIKLLLLESLREE